MNNKIMRWGTIGRWIVPLLLMLFPAACRPERPVCSPDALQLVDLIYPTPDWVVVDDLTPTFLWTYPDATCNPESFSIQVSANFAGMTGMDLSDTVNLEFDGRTLFWTPTDPLEPATLYYYQVWTESGGSFLRNGWHPFYTGPQCRADETPSLRAPTPIRPADGAVIDKFNGRWVNFLNWTDSPSCIPDGEYLIQLSTEASFTHADSAVERNTYATISSYGSSHSFSDPLTDCTRYFWRVRMDLSDPAAEDGPWSPTRFFFTDATGLCAAIPRTGVTPIPPIDFPFPEESSESAAPGWISGTVWHDLCAVPYESTDVVPPGCIALPEGGFEANGTYESGEPGLEGVTIDLGAGACPSSGLATTTTGPDGSYSFGPLTPGTYCVSVNSLSEENIPVLIPGSWTFPERSDEVVEHTITMGAGELRDANDFGWDFQFLPSPGSGVPVAKLLRDSYCRKGPSIDYESLTTLFQGLDVRIDGRNADNSWWWVRIPNSANHCWLGAENAETSGDLSQVPIVEAEPPGCWVEQQQGPDKCIAPCPQDAQPGGACTP